MILGMAPEGPENTEEPEKRLGFSENEFTDQADRSSTGTNAGENAQGSSSATDQTGATAHDAFEVDIDSDGNRENENREPDSASIEDMLLEFDEQDRLIRDRSLLDPTHVVEEDRIVGRDEQLQEVTKMLRVALGDNKPPNLFLYGPSGTGKSLITKAVCHNIRRICEERDLQFGTIEVNCQDLDTLGVAVYELTKQAADEAAVDIKVPKHGRNQGEVGRTLSNRQ